MLVDQNTGQWAETLDVIRVSFYALLKEGDEKYYWTKPGPDALLSKPASAAAVCMSQDALRSASRIILGQFKAYLRWQTLPFILLPTYTSTL